MRKGEGHGSRREDPTLKRLMEEGELGDQRARGQSQYVGRKPQTKTLFKTEGTANSVKRCVEAKQGEDCFGNVKLTLTNNSVRAFLAV